MSTPPTNQKPNPMMTAAPAGIPPCERCGNSIQRREKDPAGTTIICTICGGYTYLDHQGREAEADPRKTPPGGDPTAEPDESRNPDVREDRSANQTPDRRETPDGKETFLEELRKPDPTQDEDYYSTRRPDRPEWIQEMLKRSRETPTGIQKEDPGTPQAESPPPTRTSAETKTHHNHQSSRRPSPEETETINQPQETEMTTQEETSVLCPHCNTDHPADPSRMNPPCAKCPQCGKWHLTRPTTPEDPANEDDEMLSCIHLFYKGMKMAEISRAIKEMGGLPQKSVDIIARWTSAISKTAIKNTQECQVQVEDEWVLGRSVIGKETTKPQWAWTVTDTKSQYVLATLVTDANIMDPILAETAIARAGHPPGTIRSGAGLRQFTEQIMQQFHQPLHTTQQDTDREPDSDNTIRAHRMIRERHETMTRARGNTQTLDRHLKGIAITLNFLEKLEGTEPMTPAAIAQATPNFESWAEVAKSRTTGQIRRTVSRTRSHKPPAPPAEETHQEQEERQSGQLENGENQALPAVPTLRSETDGQEETQRTKNAERPSENVEASKKDVMEDLGKLLLLLQEEEEETREAHERAVKSRTSVEEVIKVMSEA